MDDELYAVRVPRLHPVDTAGGGDSMTAGVAATLAQGEPLETALLVGGAAGVLNIARHGLGTGNKEAVRVLAERVELRPIDGTDEPDDTDHTDHPDDRRPRRSTTRRVATDGKIMTDLCALVTNDDGIESPGLAALAGCAIDHGLEPVIAAPATESSGTSAGLTAAEDHRQIATHRTTLPALEDVPTYAVAAHPGLIAFTAARGGFGQKPDLLLSGINRGANVGRAVLHSGTVGAALTASINGLRAMAVSLDVGLATDIEYHWESAAEVAGRALDLLLDLEPGTVLNVNVPNVPPDQLRPLRRATLATFGTVQSQVQRLDDGSLEIFSVHVDDEPEPGTDAALLAAGHPTITPLRSVDEDPTVKLPDLD
ncbi:MAG TPA: PfkB family carbohydrate kinase [Pseudonocardiaceae bacterium]